MALRCVKVWGKCGGSHALPGSAGERVHVALRYEEVWGERKREPYEWECMEKEPGEVFGLNSLV